MATKKSNATPRDTPENYKEFVMQPLREAWRKGPDRHRNPESLDEAAQCFGDKSFEVYRVGRHRQWLLLQMDNIIDSAKVKHKDAAAGQETFF